jgi:hypothetical protein
MVLRGARFSRLLERHERVIPEPIEVGPQRFDAPGIQLVYAAVTLRPIDNQMRALEHAEVLRNGRTAHWEIRSQLTDRERAREQPFENRAARRVAEGANLGVWVSNHLP